MASRKPDPFRADAENPELSANEIKRLRPARDVFAEQGIAPQRPVGRPRSISPKVPLSLRLDRDVVEHFKADGPGWQTRMNEALRAAIEKPENRGA